MTLQDITEQYVVSNYLRVYTQGGDSDILTDGSGNTVEGKGIIDEHIKHAASFIHKKFGVYLSPQRVCTHPEAGDVQGTTFDILGNPLDYRRDDMKEFLQLNLPSNNVSQVTKIKMYVANVKMGEIPIEWVVIKNQRAGVINIVPATGVGIVALAGAVPVLAGVYWYRDYLPGFWNIDYTTGLSELTDELVHAICLAASIYTLGIIGTAKALGVGSESISFDALSHSVTKTAGPTATLYSNLIAEYKKQLDELTKPEKITQYKGWRIIGL